MGRSRLESSPECLRASCGPDRCSPAGPGSVPIASRALSIGTMKSRSTMSQPSWPISSRIDGRVAADVQPHARAHRMQFVDQSFFVRPDELPIELRTDQRCGRIAHADQVHTGLDLGPRKSDAHLQREFEQLAHEIGIVEEVHHQRVDAAQVGRFGARALDPAFNQLAVPHPLAEQSRRHARDRPCGLPRADREWSARPGCLCRPAGRPFR